MTRRIDFSPEALRDIEEIKDYLKAEFGEDNKAEYDEKKLCKFIGTILMPIALLLPSVAIGNIYGIRWLLIAYEVLVACLVIFSLIYANTGNRFKA